MTPRRQPSLFDGSEALPPPPPALVELARRLPPAIRFGTSTWTYDGWAGDVYHRDYHGPEPARRLEEYARYPLFGTVGIDSAFYDPPTEERLAAYARALAAVALGETPEVEPMLEAGGAFRPAGEALAALAAGDAGRYRAAVDAIVADFAARDEHLSGVAVADTAMVLERLAEPRGMAVRPASPLIP